MKTKSLLCFTAALTLPGLLCAQAIPTERSIPSTRSNEKPSPGQVMAAALTLRSNTTARVASGELTPEQAVARLRQAGTPSGLDIDADGGMGLAVIDVAQRLLMQGKLVEAKALFIEAEKALDRAIKKTPDGSAREKAMYLRSAAHIRGRYLNKIAQAKSDLEEAIKLRPDDRRLKQAKDELARANAEYFQDQPRG